MSKFLQFKKFCKYKNVGFCHKLFPVEHARISSAPYFDPVYTGLQQFRHPWLLTCGRCHLK